MNILLLQFADPCDNVPRLIIHNESITESNISVTPGLTVQLIGKIRRLRFSIY